MNYYPPGSGIRDSPLYHIADADASRLRVDRVGHLEPLKEQFESSQNSKALASSDHRRAAGNSVNRGSPSTWPSGCRFCCRRHSSRLWTVLATGCFASSDTCWHDASASATPHDAQKSARCARVWAPRSSLMALRRMASVRHLEHHGSVCGVRERVEM